MAQVFGICVVGTTLATSTCILVKYNAPSELSSIGLVEAVCIKGIIGSTYI